VPKLRVVIILGKDIGFHSFNSVFQGLVKFGSSLDNFYVLPRILCNPSILANIFLITM
jgi:hypothetical protein